MRKETRHYIIASAIEWHALDVDQATHLHVRLTPCDYHAHELSVVLDLEHPDADIDEAWGLFCRTYNELEAERPVVIPEELGATLEQAARKSWERRSTVHVTLPSLEGVPEAVLAAWMGSNFVEWTDYDLTEHPVGLEMWLGSESEREARIILQVEQ